MLVNFSLVMSPCVFSFENFVTKLALITRMRNMPGFYVVIQMGFLIGLVGTIITIPNTPIF